MQNKSEHSLEQVLEDNKEKIYRICRIYAVSPVEPQDLFQEVVFQIWKSFSSFKAKSSIDTWVYKIALNVCFRSKLNLEKANSKVVKLDSIQFVPVDNASDSYEEEKYKALHDCIYSLNESDQSIVVLYLEELPYKEIASITGLSENHIAVKMKRIKQQLFNCISPKLN